MDAGRLTDFNRGEVGGAREERDTSGRLRRRRHGSQTTGMAAWVTPQGREAVRRLVQGFTRDDSPGEDECRDDGARDSLFG
jgi:hypothetical protein